MKGSKYIVLMSVKIMMKRSQNLVLKQARETPGEGSHHVEELAAR